MKQIEDTFKEFTTREDIAIVLINQFVRPPEAVVPDVDAGVMGFGS